jgi:uncharacterized BrkB/YihY/UPF0761 family membrane protein
MSGIEDRAEDAGGGRSQRVRAKVAATMASTKDAGERHLVVAVPLRAVERNRRVAASVLAGGLAYRLFLWLLPFGLIIGGALGFLNADSTENAAEGGGLPAAISDAIGDATRSTQSDSWWLLTVGVALLLWAGYSGAKAVRLIHSLVWDEPPSRGRPLLDSLVFSGVLCVVWGEIALRWWIRDETGPSLILAILAVAPLAALLLWVFLHLPHRDAPWQALLPGALLVAIGFQVMHEVVVIYLGPKLESSTSLYGSLGFATTIIFFVYLIATLFVAAPVLNSSIHDELS